MIHTADFRVGSQAGVLGVDRLDNALMVGFFSHDVRGAKHGEYRHGNLRPLLDDLQCRDLPHIRRVDRIHAVVNLATRHRALDLLLRLGFEQ